jgi:hypothetical protein
MKPDELRLYRTPCQSCRTMQKMFGSPTGPSVRFVFASLPTRMIVVKLGDGSLWINSPVAVLRETHRPDKRDWPYSLSRGPRGQCPFRALTPTQELQTELLAARIPLLLSSRSSLSGLSFIRRSIRTLTRLSATTSGLRLQRARRGILPRALLFRDQGRRQATILFNAGA